MTKALCVAVGANGSVRSTIMATFSCLHGAVLTEHTGMRSGPVLTRRVGFLNRNYTIDKNGAEMKIDIPRLSRDNDTMQKLHVKPMKEDTT